MRSTVMLASMGAASVSAIIPQAFPIPLLVPRHAPTSYNFTLSAATHSHQRGLVHQLSDGQNRLGDGSIPVANFTFRSGPNGGGIVDSRGRGCIITPGPAKQFQCDAGVGPGPGFDLSCSGYLLYNGSKEFWACAVNDHGIENIYSEPVPNQKKCVYIELYAGPGFSNRTNCTDPAGKTWIYPWDKLNNNSMPVHPWTQLGKLQFDSYPKPAPGDLRTGGYPWPAPPIAVSGKATGHVGVQSPDGRCGAPTGFHCFGKAAGSCCSSHGWCGNTVQHCGNGCQSDFGNCEGSPTGKLSNTTSASTKASSKTFGKATSSATSSSKSKPSASSVTKQGTLSQDGMCGGTSGFHCDGFGAGSCCSSSGWCGSSPVHCGDGCQAGFGSCESSSSTNPPDNSTNSSNSPLASYGCPHDLKGAFEEPRSIIPVDKAHSDKALGSKSHGIIDDEHCTLYSFDIGASAGGKKCSLVWLFPEEKDLDSSSYSFKSDSNSSALMEFWHVRDSFSEKLTWDGIGTRKIIAAGPVGPGFSCNAKTVPCLPGQEHKFMVCGQHFSLKYSQNSTLSATGLYLRMC